MKKYTYPECKTVDVVEDWFGTPLPDPYAWLKQAKEAEVLDFVARENAYTDAYFDDAAVQQKMAALKAAKLPELPRGLAAYRDGYVGTINESGNYCIHILDKDLNSNGLFPAIKGMEEYTTFEVAPSPVDDRYVAAMMQYPGASRPVIVVYDTAEEKVLFKSDMTFSYCWSKGNGCLYTSTTESNSEAQTCITRFVRYDPKTGAEEVVYSDDRYCIFGQVYSSDDGAYVMALLSQDYCCGVWAAVNTLTGETSLICSEPTEWYYIDSRDGKHYFVTMSDAKNGAVIAVSNDGSVTTVLAGQDAYILESGFVSDGKIYILAKKDVSSAILSLETGCEVALPGEFSAVSLLGKCGDSAILVYESFLNAPEVFLFQNETFRSIRKTDGRTWPDLTVEQKFIPSADGTKIPCYVVSRKDLVKDGNAPAVMYAYGGYNISMPPWYREMVTNLSIPDWVSGGGVYVHLNLRGGNEYGAAWHEAGMGMTKRHCYEDFISIAEAMIAEGYTSKGKIGITGCSNGGLLMSALVTMRPDLWGCVIDSVPHTDMIHFAEDDRGPMYITEYGNPRQSKEMFEYLLSYSPYHNVRAVDYPPTYIQTGEMDNNVPPYHGKKFAARMQAMNTSDHPILLRVLAKGSHDRGQGEVFWQTISEMQLFLEQHLKG